MSKKRVYELAREVGLESKIVIQKLQEIGIPVASHQSALDEKQVIKFHSALGKASGSSEDSSKKPVVRRRKRAPAVEASEESTSVSVDEEVEQESPVFSQGLPEKKNGEPLTLSNLFSDKKEASTSLESEVKESSASTSESSQPEKVSAPVVEAKETKTEIEAPKVSTPSEAIKSETPSEVKVASPVVSDDKPEVQMTNKKETNSEAESSETNKKTAISSESDDPKMTERKEPVKASPTPAKKFQGGATIVRRATKEESEALQLKESHRYKKKEDPQPSSPRSFSSAKPGFVKRREPGESSGGYSSGARPTRFSSSEGSATSSTTSTSGQKSTGTKFSSPAAPGKFEKRTPQFSEDAKPQRTFQKPRKTRFSSNDDSFSSPRKMRVFSNSSYDSGRRRDMRSQRQAKLKKTEITVPRQEYRIVKMERDTMTVSELALQLNIKAAELIKKLMQQGVMATVNQEVDSDTVALIAGEYNFECKSVKKTEADVLKDEVINPEDLQSRPPIITVMGHVDHGKTSILDAIRKTGVADKEAGGITQHIGAYMVNHAGSKLTFLDTPGHEAFSAMRSRGAQLTDIVILVVAADDGVMPQTIEAIAHAKASNVPVVVAVNKVDKENVNFDRIYSELSEQGIQSESWGGDVQFVHVSALKKEGLDQLLEAIHLQAELLDLKATEKGLARGTVVEAHLDKGRGAVATAIVTQGVLSIGDFVVAGSVTGRVRAMVDHDGRKLKKAYPSMPVEIIGLSDIPLAADSLNVVADDKTAREVGALRLAAQNEGASTSTSAQSLDDLLGQVQAENIPQISVLLKADTQGTVEAISEAITKLKSEKVSAKIIYKGVGGISESDLNLAETCNAVILGFNVRMASSLLVVSEKKSVSIQYFSVIYKLVDAVKGFMAGKLPPVTSEVIQGHAEVKEAIRIPKIGLIAGSSVTDGKITRNSHLRLVRNNVVIHTGKLSALKRFKDDVKEVQNGYECGISFENCTDIKTGDVIESYIIEESPAELDI